MQLTLELIKNCAKVDKYQLIDAKGKPVNKDPKIGPVYLEKSIMGGAKKIQVTIVAC